jgi:hypothetical protein
MVIEILIARAQAVDPLAKQRLLLMLNLFSRTCFGQCRS